MKGMDKVSLKTDGVPADRKRELEEKIKVPSPQCEHTCIFFIKYLFLEKLLDISQASQERIANIRRRLSNQAGLEVPNPSVPGFLSAYIDGILCTCTCIPCTDKLRTCLCMNLRSTPYRTTFWPFQCWEWIAAYFGG